MMHTIDRLGPPRPKNRSYDNPVASASRRARARTPRTPLKCSPVPRPTSKGPFSRNQLTRKCLIVPPPLTPVPADRNGDSAPRPWGLNEPGRLRVLLLSWGGIAGTITILEKFCQELTQQGGNHAYCSVLSEKPTRLGSYQFPRRFSWTHTDN